MKLKLLRGIKREGINVVIDGTNCLGVTNEKARSRLDFDK